MPTTVCISDSITVVPAIRIQHCARDQTPSVVLPPTKVTNHLLNLLNFLVCRHLERHVSSVIGTCRVQRCSTNLIKTPHPLFAICVNTVTPKEVLNECSVFVIVVRTGAVALEYRSFPVHAGGATVTLSSTAYMSRIDRTFRGDGLAPSGGPHFRSGSPVFSGCTPAPTTDWRGPPSTLPALLGQFFLKFI